MAEFAEKYFRKGTKIAISGRIQTGNYTNREGQKVYTTEVVIEEQEFAESKAASQQNNVEAERTYSGNQQAKQPQQSRTSSDGFMDVDDDVLPFN